LLSGSDDIFGPGGAFNRLRKRLMERVLHTELSSHLGCPKNQKRPPGLLLAPPVQQFDTSHYISAFLPDWPPLPHGFCESAEGPAHCETLRATLPPFASANSDGCPLKGL
jgi:hypothetical protein